MKKLTLIILLAILSSCSNPTAPEEHLEKRRILATFKYTFIDMRLELYVQDTLAYTGEFTSDRDTAIVHATQKDNVFYKLTPTERKFGDAQFILVDADIDSIGYITSTMHFTGRKGQMYTSTGSFTVE